MILAALPSSALAISVPWDRSTVGEINPIYILDTVKGNIFTATSTTQDSTFPNFTATNGTTTNATSTNLFTSNLTIGSLSGFLKATAGVVATALIDLTADITGVLPIANGGTGVTTFGGTNTVLFTTSADTLSSDTEFVYDGANLTLSNGTGTSTIAHNLKVDGDFEVDGAARLNASVVATGLTSALLQAEADGTVAEYAGTTCTNQFVRALSALGIATCASVDLTADVTGTLPVGNGGTGSTSFTAGSIPFSNGSILTQDNTNFFWDDANNRLGIGTVSPNTPLHVQSSTGSVGRFESTGVNSNARFFLQNDAQTWSWGNNGGSGDRLQFKDETGGTTPFFIEATAPDNSLIVDSSGNVGIGDTTPSTLLEINTTNKLGSTFTGTTNGEGVRVTQTDYTSGNYVSLIEGAYDDSNASANVRIAAMYDGGGSNLSFGTSNSYGSGITNEALFIDSSGNVGIGTDAPAEKLSILSDDNAQGTNIFAVRANNLAQGIALGWNEIRKIGTTANTDLIINAKGSGDLLLQTDATGNVGIGTASPQQRLDVRDGNVQVGGFGGGSDYGFIFTPGDAGTYGWLANHKDANAFQIGAGATIGTNPYLTVGLEGSIAGSVGIGTSTPASTLDINGGARTATGTVTDGATVTIDASVGNNHTVTLGGNRTLAFSNLVVGQKITLAVTQDATGSRTLAYPAAVTFGSAGTPTLDTAAGSTDIITFWAATSTATIHARFAD